MTTKRNNTTHNEVVVERVLIEHRTTVKSRKTTRSL